MLQGLEQPSQALGGVHRGREESWKVSGDVSFSNSCRVDEWHAVRVSLFFPIQRVFAACQGCPNTGPTPLWDKLQRAKSMPCFPRCGTLPKIVSSFDSRDSQGNGKKVKCLSLFTGVAGLELGLRQHPWRVFLLLSEILHGRDVFRQCELDTTDVQLQFLNVSSAAPLQQFSDSKVSCYCST